MSLGGTIARQALRPAGSWTLLSEGDTLDLSAIAEVQISGGGLPAANALFTPRLITLTLRPALRRLTAPELRAALLPYCRREAGTISVQYDGAQRSVQLISRYLDGLDALAPRFQASDPRWLGTLQPGQALPGSVALVGSAAAEPSITMDGGASGGTVSEISLSNAGYADLYLRLLFNLTIGAGERVIIHGATRSIRRTPGGASALGALQPGSQLASFLLYPGVNQIGMVLTGSITATLQYEARYWSWEDTDV